MVGTSGLITGTWPHWTPAQALGLCPSQQEHSDRAVSENLEEDETCSQYGQALKHNDPSKEYELWNPPQCSRVLWALQLKRA